MQILIIAAIAKNRVIGHNGKIPWYIREELQHFKAVTLGNPVIMGRRTFESLQKPLKGRLNVVITRDPSYQTSYEEVKVTHNLEQALNICKAEKAEKAFIIGGGEIYRQALEISDEMVLSIVDQEPEGDTYFPEIDMNKWEKVSEDDHALFRVVRYIRRKKQTE